MAFVSSLTPSSFVGAGLSSKTSVTPVLPAAARPATANVQMNGGARMKTYGLDKVLARYVNAAQRIAVVPLRESSSYSRVWNRFAKMMNEASAAGDTSYKTLMERIRAMSRAEYRRNVTPEVTAADAYMAGCVASQYKEAGCPTGVYSVSCTEGTTKFQAEDSRVVSLGMDFRRNQRTTGAKYGEMFENRRRAVAAAHLCSYEESLFVKYRAAAGKSVTASAESMGVCARLALPTAEGEDYMMCCVEQQCKRQAVPYGVYGVTCTDGTTKLMAENRRITALSAKYRSAQWSDIGKEQRKYDSSKHARDNFSLGCDYEEDLFNRFPGVAASMSGLGSKY